MESTVKIYLKNEFILIVLDEDAKYSTIYNDICAKLKDLKLFYEKNNYPIVITGKQLQEKQEMQLKDLFMAVIGVSVKFQSKDNYLGIHSLMRTYKNGSDMSYTKFHVGTLRSGGRIVSDGSIVILGDLKPGSEVIARDNIIVMGKIMGLAHAGAMGDIKAYIACNEIDTKQIRIANIIRTRDLNYSKDDFIMIKIKDESIALF